MVEISELTQIVGMCLKHCSHDTEFKINADINRCEIKFKHLKNIVKYEFAFGFVTLREVENDIQDTLKSGLLFVDN